MLNAISNDLMLPLYKARLILGDIHAFVETIPIPEHVHVVRCRALGCVELAHAVD